MKNILTLCMSVLIVMPIVAMDKDAIQNQKTKVDLPTTHDNNHPIIKVVNQAYLDFLAEKNGYARSREPIFKHKQLTEMGENALKQAKDLIWDLITARGKDKGIFETEKLKMGILHQTALDISSSNHEREKVRLSANLLAEEETVTEYRKDLAAKKLELKNIQNSLQASHARQASLSTQRNGLAVALAACMASFIGYIVCVQWK